MSDATDQRKLAAIMFTDMVGFSALSQRDEALALELLEEHRTLIRAIVRRHGGREVKTIGDGFLLEFSSALSAVQAAVEIQQTLHTRNQSVPGERQVRLRIGVHVGDVVQRGGDIHGDGVNIASRLEPLAKPGGICVSEDVARAVRNKLSHPLAALGMAGLKHIDLPMAVYQIVIGGEGAAESTHPKRSFPVAWAVLGGLLLAGAALAIWVPWRAREVVVIAPANAAPLDKKSVAVLAFTNLSEDKNNEYFSDGVSEELLNVLAKIPGLKVSARTSAFFFKGKQVPIAEIAKQLGVAYVVEGSVRKSGDRLRITAQLINAADGFHVWSDNFDREAKDVFAVQDEIAGLIAHNLQLKIEGGNSEARAVNPRALELYLQGRAAWNLRTTEGFARAEDLFHRALALDPEFARAYTGLADVRIIRESSDGDLGFFGNRDSPALAEIVAQIERALALDPNSAEAYASLGNARWLSWKFAEAEAALRRAIALNPNYASAHHWLGRILLSDGRIEESSRELARAAELDPLSSRILDNYSLMLQVQGKYEEALALVDRALALQPDAEQAAHWRAIHLSALGRHAEALAQLRRLPVGGRFYVPWVVKVLVDAGLRPEAEQAMKELTPQAAHFKYVGLAALGRPDEALAAMPADFILVVLVSELYLNPDLDPIRNDPRFVQLLATLGRTEANSRAQAWRAAHPSPSRK